jgi:endonuclease YncB( thermonuclease family)
MLGIAAIAAGAIGVLTGLPSDLFGRVPLPSGVITADADAVAVVDGDTLRLRDTVIRLRGVSAPARGAVCHTGDGTAYDCGRAAAAALGRMLVGRAVACRLDGRDGHGLPQGDCEAGGTEVNRAIIAAGWARAATGRGADSDAFADAEQQARAALLGLWRDASAPVF